MNEELDFENDEELDFEDIENIIDTMLTDPEVTIALKKLKINHTNAMNMMKTNLEENGLAQGDEESIREACSRYIQTYILNEVSKKYINELFTPEDVNFSDTSIDEEERNELVTKHNRYLEDGEYEKLKRLILQNPKSVVFLLDEATFEQLSPEQQADFKKYVLPRMKIFNEALKNVAIDKDADTYEEEPELEEENEKELEDEESTEITEVAEESIEKADISEEPKEEHDVQETVNEENNGLEITVEPDLKDMQTQEEYDLSEAEMSRYYDLYEANEAYLEAHPDLREATFVQATGGTDLEKFAMTLLILQKQSETRVIGIFNNISIDVSECNDIGEIIETFNENKEIEQEKAKEGVIREKGEFLNEGLYYSQFYKDAENKYALIEQFRHQAHYPENFEESAFDGVFQMRDDCPDVGKFLEAAMYNTQNPMAKTYIEVSGVILCANEFKSQEELAQKVDEIRKIQQYNNAIEAHPEKYPGKEKKDIFIHSKSYYQSLVAVNRKATEAQIEATGNPKAKVLQETRGTNFKQLSEAVKYFGTRNPDIYMKTIDGDLIRPADLATFEDFEEERKKQETAETLRTERDNEVFESGTNGISMEEVEAVLAAITLENLESVINSSKTQEIAQQIMQEGIQRGMVKDEHTHEESTTAMDINEETDEHPFPSLPEER